MIALSFLNPLLLWGAGLASIPLIIHILNRRRYKVIHWAAMEFLLKAFKENRRRIRFEQLLLLLLRMGVVALLAFLLSRPKASSDDFGPFARSTIHHVVILDESGSMGETAGAGNAFDVAKNHVVGRVDALARDRSGDLFTLLRSSSTRPDVFARPVSMGLLTEVRDLLKPSRPTPDRFDLASALGRALDAIKKVPPDQVDRHYLYIISDFKTADLVSAEGRFDERVLQNLRKLDPPKILLSPCGRTTNANLAITAIRLQESLVIKNQPAHFAVLVENQGARSSDPVPLGFSLDGSARKERMLPALGPGEHRVETFRAQFERAGSHWVLADLPRDRMPIDDERVLAFRVAESAKVLLVDGDPGESEERSETFYLQFALDPLGDAAFGLEITRVDDNEIAEREFGPYDLLVLANVAMLDDETNDRLDAYAKDGGGLMFFTGDQVDRDTWNKLFWREGAGPLPAPILDLAGDMDNPENIVLSPERHPMFLEPEALAKSLSFVGVHRYFTTGSEADGIPEGGVPDETKVLVRVGHEAGPPLLVEKAYHKSRVALCLTTADAGWTRWAANPSYVLVIRMATEFLMRREDLKPYNLDARTVFSKSFSAADYHTDVRFSAARPEDEDRIAERGFTAAPRADDPDLLELRAAPQEGRVWPAAACYEITLRRGDQKEEPLYFTVSPWEGEGRPQALDNRTLESLFPPEYHDRIQFIEQQSVNASLLDEGEIWRWLAFGLLAGLLLETFLAWKFGHR